MICLGNITNSSTILQFLTNISPQFNLVKGEFDNPVVLSQQLSLLNKSSNIPLYNRFVHDNLKIGYTNGFQVIPRGDPLALSAFARELDVDVLIWGGTHKVEAYTLDGKFLSILAVPLVLSTLTGQKTTRRNRKKQTRAKMMMKRQTKKVTTPKKLNRK